VSSDLRQISAQLSQSNANLTGVKDYFSMAFNDLETVLERLGGVLNEYEDRLRKIEERVGNVEAQGPPSVAKIRR